MNGYLSPYSSHNRSLTALQMISPARDEAVHEILKGMKPWLAFFSLYSNFLKKNGWNHSVDMEAYHIGLELGRQVVFLETIEEQIDVLEGLSQPQIVDFLCRVDHWSSCARQFARWYLAGDLANIAANRFGFPTRDPWVIDRRDAILYERMLPHLDRGDCVACVGVPHVVGIGAMLRRDGFEVNQSDGRSCG